MDDASLELYAVLWDGRQHQVICKLKVGDIIYNGCTSEPVLRMASNPSANSPTAEELRRILLSNIQIVDDQPRGAQYGRRGGYATVQGAQGNHQSLTSQYIHGFGNQIMPVERANVGFPLPGPSRNDAQGNLQNLTSQYVSGFGNQVGPTEHANAGVPLPDSSRNDLQGNYQNLTSQYINGFGNQIMRAEQAHAGSRPPRQLRRDAQRFRQDGAQRGLFDWRMNQLRNPVAPTFNQYGLPSPSPASYSFQDEQGMKVFFAQCAYLDKVAAGAIAENEIDSDELQQKHVFRDRLKKLCNDAIHAQYPRSSVSLHLEPYGSIASGFATKGADMDLAVQLSGPLPSESFLKELPHSLESAILGAGHGARLLTRTRVPILKVCEAPNPELYQALVEERNKIDEQHEHDDHPVVDSNTAPNLGTNAIGNSSHPRSSALTVAVPQHDPYSKLVAFASQKRAETDDLAVYADTFKSQALPMVKAHLVSVWEAAALFLQGLPQSVETAIRGKISLDLTQPPITALNDLIDSVITQSVALANQQSKQTKPNTEKKIKPWSREKKMGPLDFPKTGVGVLCDINFSNELAVHNTRLLRFYSLCDARVRLMVLVVKTWAQRRKINSPYSGTLGSYGYVLMVLHFLMNVASPPVIPNLQSPAAFKITKRPLVGQWDVSFFDEAEYINIARSEGRISQNNDPLGVLLRNFFHYYAHQGPHVVANGFNWSRHVISIRMPGGILLKEDKGWTAAKTTLSEDNVEVRQRYIFAIEDPFELDHNVARTVTHNGIVAIRDEFRLAWKILTMVGDRRAMRPDLLDELVEPESDPVQGEGEPSSSGANFKSKGKAKADVVDGAAEAIDALVL